MSANEPAKREQEPPAETQLDLSNDNVITRIDLRDEDAVKPPENPWQDPQ